MLSKLHYIIQNGRFKMVDISRQEQRSKYRNKLARIQCKYGSVKMIQNGRVNMADMKKKSFILEAQF